MELIIGGRSQGKLDYVKDKYPNLTAVNMENAPVRAAYESEIIYGLHFCVKKILDENGDVLEFLKELMTKNPEAVVVCDEVGSGIIPMDPGEREYRETVGRACCILAKESASVVRMVCGLETKLK